VSGSEGTWGSDRYAVYDDRIIVLYNIHGCKDVSHADMFNAANDIPANEEMGIDPICCEINLGC